MGKEIRVVSKGKASLTDFFDDNTGRFLKHFGEMEYDQAVASRSNIHITEGMWNENGSGSLSNQIRYQIQTNAVERQLAADPDFFSRFGCDKKTPSTIVKWFSNNKSGYTLHETKVGTVQIVDSRLHQLYHSGGVAMKKSDLISGDGNNPYPQGSVIEELSPAEKAMVAQMREPQNNSNSTIDPQICNMAEKQANDMSDLNEDKVLAQNDSTEEQTDDMSDLNEDKVLAQNGGTEEQTDDMSDLNEDKVLAQNGGTEEQTDDMSDLNEDEVLAQNGSTEEQTDDMSDLNEDEVLAQNGGTEEQTDDMSDLNEDEVLARNDNTEEQTDDINNSNEDDSLTQNSNEEVHQEEQSIEW